MSTINMESFTKNIMNHFHSISKISRKSGNEQGIADFLENFAKKLPNVTVSRQTGQSSKKKINNLVITKPGTDGYENLPPIALQAHIDMVCQPNEADFSQGIEPYMLPDGERMMGRSAADGKTPTTLGADDGIGVACIMAILESTEIKHPPIEAVLTSDEEDGMSGADKLDMNLIKAKRLINIDTEEERKFFYGCAGGVYANMALDLKTISSPERAYCLNITISGLQGGHSGIMIDKHLANANRLMGHLLNLLWHMLNTDGHGMWLVNVNGGTAHNAITKKTEALIEVTEEVGTKIYKYIDIIKAAFRAYYPNEADLQVSVDVPNLVPPPVMDKDTMQSVIRLLCDVPNGVIAMHKDIPGLVETSSNMGIVKCEDNKFHATSFVRSSVGKEMDAVVNQIKSIANNVGAECEADSGFPEWNPNINSKLKKLFEATYLDIFKVPASTESIHAGLECGYFAVKRPEMDIIAIGPTITGAHTETETLYVSTVGKVAELLLAVLERMDADMDNRLDALPAFCSHESVSNAHTHEGHVCAR